MPRYDLECAACQHRWEVQRGMNQDNPPCPVCGGVAVQLPPTGTGFVLKGGGWAASGYSHQPRKDQ